MATQTYILLGWLFVLGAIIGSFLNVVIYRLPRGLSLQRPGSHCPKCGHAIRWYDNVPVFGWLWLRGHCRDCGATISARYPLVELTVGLMFLALGWIDWAGPQQRALEADEVAAVQAAVQAAPHIAPTDLSHGKLAALPYAARFTYHLLLLCVLFCAALIDIDGQLLPRRLITWPAGVGILLAMFWPTVQAFPLWHSLPAAPEWISFRALATSFVGMLMAVIMRLAVLDHMGLKRPREMGLLNSTLALYAVGAFLGWQAVLVIGGLANTWSLAKPSAPTKNVLARIQPTAVVYFGALVWCLVEGPLAAWVHSW
ncbi:MAG TPA: prepilin peptidase [Pirellulales bacterium]|nr:prepilin peptidase [Pirellulales bacterium]